MPFNSSGELRYFTFDTFSDLQVRHAIFTRRGGVSPGPWKSLNVGGTVGDMPERVKENRGRTLKSLGVDPDHVYDSWQVHGRNIEIVRSYRQVEDPLIKADGLATRSPGLTLMMRFADCVPLLLVDPVKKAVGIAHAGWRGTILNVAASLVSELEKEFGSDPADIKAGIGPSIGPDHYEVGPDVVKQAVDAFPENGFQMVSERDGRQYFDLWGANELQLAAVGVRSIEIAGICTACNLGDWYSHRAERGRTGRFAALIQSID